MISRQYSLLMSMRRAEQREVPEERVAAASSPSPNEPDPRNTTALTMMSATVTRGSLVIVRMLWTFVRCFAHSGQRMPTDVGVMQSGQIGRPHDEHETPVTRLGWR